MILPDYMIEGYVTIEPMAAGVDRHGVISYGVTSYGYDFRLGYNFKVCNPQPFLQGLGAVLDPKTPRSVFDSRVRSGQHTQGATHAVTIDQYVKTNAPTCHDHAASNWRLRRGS